MSLFQKIRAGLRKTAAGMSRVLASGQGLDAASLEALEEAMILADMGGDVAASLVAQLPAKLEQNQSEDALRLTLAELIGERLTRLEARSAIPESRRPHVVLMVGVNGSGKTTTIGKMAQRLAGQGHTVHLGAGDTFRAAAIDQLAQWAQSTGCGVTTTVPGRDPAALAYDALDEARQRQVDVLLIDTAGRLHNRQDLMDELSKMVRVLGKAEATAPHDILLVLDATTGQNALSQVATFQSLVPVSGLVVTKLDGTAKGGFLVALAERFALPVRFVGLGERAEDLQPFDGQLFARALMGLDGP